MLPSDHMITTASPSRHPMIKLFARVICVIGCIMHLVALNVDYLKYKTDVMYSPYISLNQTVPSESICFVPRSANETKMMFMEHEPGEALDTSIENVTLQASSVIENCRIRNFTTNLVEKMDNCSDLFSASLWVRMNYYYCYTMKLRKQVEFSTLRSTSSIANRDMIYSFSLVKNFTEFNRITFAIHFTDWPYEELIYAITEDVETFSQPKRFSYLQAFEIFEFQRLKPPYSTQCIAELPSYCFSNSRLNHSICSASQCSQKLAVINNYLLKDSESGISVKVQPMNGKPIKRVEHVASVQLNHFLVDTFNVLALWCSLSVNLLSQGLMNLLEKKQLVKSAPSFTHWQNILIEVSKRVQVDLLHLNMMIEDRYKASKHHLWRNRIIWLARLLILLACTYEMIKISIDFLQYKTNMEIDLELNAKIQIPDLAHCVDVQQYLNVSKPRWQFETLTEEACDFSRRFNYTLKNLFDLTPDPASVVKKCRVRRSFESPLTTEYDCHQYFNVSKFFHDEFLCYLIQPVTPRILDGEMTRERENNPHILYSVVVSDELARISRQQAIVTYGFPTKSRFLSNRMFKSDKNELVVLSFYVYTYEKLESPYDTDCCMGGNQNDCLLKCLNYSSINRIPYSELLTEPVDKKLVDFTDLKNHTIAQLIIKKEAQCSRECKEVCNDFIAKTVQQNAYSSGEKLEVAINLPRYPLFKFKAVARRTCYEFLYQLACCASFWIGFSLILLLHQLRSCEPLNHAPTRLEYLCALTQELEKIVQSKLDSIEGIKKQLRKERMTRYFKKKSKSFMFIIVLTVGFLCHSFNWATMYFEYPTRMNTQLGFETGLKDMRATVCVTLDQLNLTTDYSLKNIWAQSPRTDEIMLQCGYRGFYSSYSAGLPEILRARLMPHIESPLVCNSVFRLKKRVTLGMVCYEVRPKLGEDELAEYNARYHLLGPKNFLFLTLRQVIAKYRLLVSVSTGKADVSLLFASTIPETGAQQSLRYWIGYFKFTQTLLRANYQSGVFGGLRQIMCNRKCVARDTLDNLNRLSPYGEIDYAADINHETLEQSVSNESLVIQRACEEKCNHSLGEEKLTKTYYRTYYSGPFNDNKKSEDGTISLWFRSTDCLSPHASFIESFRVLDLVIYVGTIYTLWFGLSVLRTMDFIFSPSPFTILSSYEREFIFDKFKRFNDMSTVVPMITLQPMMQEDNDALSDAK